MNNKIICIAGKNDIAVEILEYLLQNYNYQILVMCDKTDEGVDTWQKSLRLAANKHNIEITTLMNIYHIFDLIFLSLEFDKIIKPELFATKQLYNVHFSLLPAYKGMYTSVLPILFGEKQSGVTLHKIDSGIDTGDIIDQKIIPILENDKAEDLYTKYITAGIEIVKTNISNILGNNVKSYPQSRINASYFSKTAIDFNNIVIDFRKTAWEIHNQIRAYIFSVYQLPTICGYKIYKSEILNEKSDKNHIGRILRINKNTLRIDSIDYVVYAYIK